MLNAKWLALVPLLLLLSTGCTGMFAGPGPEREQRRLSARFDPYPNPDLGPEVVGGRPREFQNPLSESERAHGFLMGSRPAPPQAVIPTPAVLPPSHSPFLPPAPPFVPPASPFVPPAIQQPGMR